MFYLSLSYNSSLLNGTIGKDSFTVEREVWGCNSVVEFFLAPQGPRFDLQQHTSLTHTLTHTYPHIDLRDTWEPPKSLF